jgi:hypothetical protein
VTQECTLTDDASTVTRLTVLGLYPDAILELGLLHSWADTGDRFDELMEEALNPTLEAEPVVTETVELDATLTDARPQFTIPTDTQARGEIQRSCHGKLWTYLKDFRVYDPELTLERIMLDT